VALEDVMNVDMSGIMLSLVKLTARCSGTTDQRIKMKYCTLCESICSRTDNLTLRKDSPVRHEVLHYLYQWMSPSVCCNMSFLRQYLLSATGATGTEFFCPDRPQYGLSSGSRQALRSLRAPFYGRRGRNGPHSFPSFQQVLNCPSLEHRDMPARYLGSLFAGSSRLFSSWSRSRTMPLILVPSIR